MGVWIGFAFRVTVEPCGHGDGAAFADHADDGVEGGERLIVRLLVANAAAFDELGAEQIRESVGVVDLGHYVFKFCVEDARPEFSGSFRRAENFQRLFIEGDADVALCRIAFRRNRQDVFVVIQLECV